MQEVAFVVKASNTRDPEGFRFIYAKGDALMNKFLKNSVAAVAITLLVAACSGPGHRSAGQSVDDGVVLTRVKSALISNDATKARQIDVEVYKGEVQLNGFVDSETAKSAATNTAKGVEGVTDVRNNLQIRAADRTAGQMVDDGVIATKVKTALIRDDRTKGYQIEVAVNSGVVQLAGFVDDPTSKTAATEVADSVDDVKSVKNQIQVRE
jgi:hyperosmotically inducible protein